jgi:hypothetical protein
MTVPNSSEFIRVMKMMNGMVGELDKAIKPAKPVFQAMKDSKGMAKDLVSVGKRSKFIQGEYEFWKGSAQRALKAKDAVKLRESIQETAKTTKSIKERFEAFGKALNKGKPLGMQGWAGLGAALATLAVLTADIKVREFLRNIDEGIQDRLSADLSKAYSNISRAVLLSRRNTEDIIKLNESIRTTNTNVKIQNQKIAEARKLGNDALYETRQQQKTFQQRVNEIFKGAQAEIQKAYKTANEALYETRQGRVKVEAQITAQSAKINQQNTSYNNQITQLKQQFQQLSTTVDKGVGDSLASTINTLKQGVAEAKAEANKAKDFATTVSRTLELAKAITEATKQAVKVADTKAETALAEAIKNGATLKIVDGKIEIAAQNAAKVYVGKVIEPRVFVAEQKVRILSEGLSNVANDVHKFKEEARNKIGITSAQIETIDKKLNTTTKEVNTTKQDINNINADLNKIGTKLKDIEKVDKQANEKLDKLVGGITMIPPLIMNVGNSIKTQIPTIPQIENAAAVGTCRTTQPGGCSSNMMNDLANNINGNANANHNDLLGKLNLAGQGADLALLGIINNKLGNQVEGGLSGMLKRFASNAVIDRLLNLMIFSATLHNAWMLSNNLGQTLMSIVDNVLGFFGIKDGEGQNVSIGLLIGSSVENFVKSIIGTENYIKLTEDLAKANRIYQATTNIINSFQNLSSVILNALEVTVGRIGKIGNALRQAGEVLENAYTWMNPQPKFNRITQTLESLNQGASTIQMVTQIPLDIAQATTDLTNSATELTKALKEDGKPENKGTSDNEPEILKAEKIASKAVSAGKDMTEQTLEPDEDEEIV